MFHIHLPFGDGGIQEIERALGIKFQEVHVQLVKKEDVQVCPMSDPDPYWTGLSKYIDLK